jgi:cytochrome c
LQGAQVSIVLVLLPFVASAQGDAVAGERAFRQCAACHAIDAEWSSSGPNLVGIVGRAAASLDGPRYSDALSASGIVWDAETLAAFLADPRAFVPGTSMTVGVRRAEDIPDIIAYLETL